MAILNAANEITPANLTLTPMLSEPSDIVQFIDNDILTNGFRLNRSMNSRQHDHHNGVPQRSKHFTPVRVANDCMLSIDINLHAVMRSFCKREQYFSKRGNTKSESTGQ